MSKSIFIISYFEGREKKYLKKLINQLMKIDCQIGVVINDDKVKKIFFEKIDNIFYLTRKNIGMNIGAWDAGYKYFDNYENYFFFQDECFIKNYSFFEHYLYFLSQKNAGIIGDSMNTKWSETWEKMFSSPLNYSININKQKIDRVSYYKKQIEDWDIPISETPIHLRSLNIALKKKILDKINGFNIGFFREQCVAAEIAISKKIESLNLQIAQSHQKPFYFIGHEEWNYNNKKQLNQINFAFEKKR